MSEFNNPWAADHSSWYNEEATKWLSPKNKPSDSKIKKVSRDDFSLFLHPSILDLILVSYNTLDSNARSSHHKR